MSDPGHGNNHRPPQLASHGIAPGGSPAPSSASNQSPLSPGSALPTLGPTSRPSTGLGPVQYQQFHPLGPSHRHPGLPQPYYGAVIGPSQQQSLPGYHEISHAAPVYGDHTALQVNHQIQGQQGQKRAYRQRRKDPSCDACRERKVKCDATDSSSCTECKSRNVNCQFTKETNRRMSSIKQNQDLSKDLAIAQTEISRLTSLLSREKTITVGSTYTGFEHLPVPASHQTPNHDLMHLPVYDRYAPPSLQEEVGAFERPFKRRRVSDGGNTAKIGANMTKFGRGIFKSPNAETSIASHTATPTPSPDLPHKDVADVLLRRYQTTIHPTLPLVKWKTFQDQYEAVYRDGSLHNIPSTWCAFLFAVFACGTLHRSWPEGRKYQEVSKSLVNSWTENLTMDHVRAALLNAMFLVESNSKSAGSIWMGIAVRVCFDLGLNCEVGAWSPMELEFRRRLWWATYACDCMLALEMGRAPMIKEEDCLVSTPSPVSDDFISDGTAWMDPTPEMKMTALLPTIRVIGPIARLFKLLRLREIPQDTLQIYDSHFDRVLGTFPPHHQFQNPELVDPIEIFHLVYLQNARLILHRHNLQPHCGPQARLRAMDKCVDTAKSTATLLHKCMQDPPPTTTSSTPEHQATWKERIMFAASAFICTHIWRCTLVLLFRRDFEAALTCARFSSILSDLRPVNTACGRYLDFVLAQIIQKVNQRVDVDTDEELIAYVSGDLQGNYESSWVWQDDPGGSQGCPTATHSAQTPEDAEQTDPRKDLEWAGWDRIVRLIDELANQQQQGRETHRAAPGEVRMPPMHLPPLTASPSPSSATTPRDRLSIKDLL